ncbi:non-ribosomal peptide synthetase [Aneurinibacillus aneurinilyticus]|uniref:Non-ribosomal peptide synthetase n=1 Tax=Aneurinibacillus aneurinilyticus TaxID=1391 RepID=A0A848CTJ3_ANEAE|nr:non-ribosomal peptide synthetase [Aneurinibacillus aneurinilyticus]NME98925.1 non-ribosomal peptide synthetase [Aneurinibacillus aneurinilyticus]
MTQEIRWFDKNAYEAKRYWEERLSAIIERATSAASVTQGSGTGPRLIKTIEIGKETTRIVRNITGGSPLLEYAFFIAAFYTGFRGTDVITYSIAGIPSTSSRDSEQILPTVVEINPSIEAEQLLYNLLEQLREAYNHQQVDLSRIINDVWDRDQRLDEVVIRHTGLHRVEAMKELQPVITIETIDEGYRVHLDCYVGHPDRFRMQSSLELLSYISTQFAEYPHIQLGELHVAHDTESLELLRMGTGQMIAPTHHTSLVARFEEQVRNTPDLIAISSEQGDLTYREFAEQVRYLAHILLHQGIKEGDRVGILAERTVDTLVAIWAIGYVGATYVPIEVEYPIERQNYMLQRSGAKLVLAREGELSMNLDIPVSSVHLNQKVYLKSDISSTQQSDSSCYVIFTSGTTGLPKLVKGRVGDVMNLCQWYISACGLGVGSRVMLAIPMGFDASVKNIFAPLLCGATIVLPGGFLAEAGAMLDQISHYRVTHLNCVPALFYSWVNADEDNRYSRLTSLSTVILGGEKLRPEPLAEWAKQTNGHCRIFNVYGPTECTSVSVACEVSLEDISSLREVPIGRPIDNKRIYVLDEQRRLCRTGFPGEIYIGGTGIAEYDAVDSEQSTTLFPDPFSKGGWMYKTGDLAVWRKDSSKEHLYFLGRKDRQWKINGHRINPEEIEACIRRHPAVRLCVAVQLKEGREGNEKWVVYLQLKPGLHMNRAELREFAAKWLPAPMIPAFAVLCKEIPLTVHGKIDMRALPQPSEGDRITLHPFRLPQSDMEKSIAGIWTDVLGVEKVGLDDHFFELGGHSLHLVQAALAIRKQLDVHIEAADILAYPTVRRLSNYVGPSEEKDQSKAELEAATRAANRKKLWEQRRRKETR